MARENEDEGGNEAEPGEEPATGVEGHQHQQQGQGRASLS